MVLVAVVLWAGIPLGCLWVGSQVIAETDSIGVALLAMAAALAAGVWAGLRLLNWLNLQYTHARERSGLDSYGNVALEGVMATSAFIALIGFCVWFFLFSGSSPVPINISY